MRKKANCESATCNGVQLQDRLAGYSLLGDDISLRICLVVGILCILIDGSHILLALLEEIELYGRLMNMSYTQNDFGINLLTEQRPYVYFSADNLIAATDTTHLYIYSPHDRQEFKYKKQGNALQLVTGEDSTFYVMKKYCFSTLQSAEYLVKEHKTVNKATGQ